MGLLIGPRRAVLGGGRVIVPFARDSFTGADGTLLQNHTADDGGTWTKHASSSTGNILIDVGRAHAENTAGARAYYHSATPPSADYDVSCDVVLLTDNNLSRIGVVARVSTSAYTFYLAQYNALANGWQLYRQVAGTATQLGSTASQALTPNQAYRLTLSVRGSSIRMLVDGAELVAATDANITATGMAGVRSENVATASTGAHLDNWQAVAA